MQAGRSVAHGAPDVKEVGLFGVHGGGNLAGEEGADEVEPRSEIVNGEGVFRLSSVQPWRGTSYYWRAA